MLQQLQRQHQVQILWMVICSTGLGIAIIWQSYLIVSIIEQIFLQGKTVSAIVNFVFLLLAMLLLRMLFSFINKRNGTKMSTSVKQKLREDVLNHFTNQSVSNAAKGQSGNKTSVFMDTVDEIDAYYSQYLPQMIQSFVVPLLILLVIFWTHWTTGVIILVTAPFIPIFMMIIGFKTKDKSEEQLSQMAAFSGTFLDILQGLPTIRLFGKSKQQREKISNSSVRFRDATMEVLRVAFTNSLALEFISMLSIGLIALEVAIRMIIFQDISFFTGFLMLLLAPEFFNQLKALGTAFHSGRSSMGAGNKLEAIFDETNNEVKWGADVLSSIKPPRLELRDMNFTYADSSFQLQSINLIINPKEQVAIIGSTGAGKSTILHIIAGLLPITEGNYYIDKYKQADVEEHSWFKQLIYISQNPYLFSGTIAENIALGSTKVHDHNEIKQAAMEAGIWEWIEQLPSGLDTNIGEAGRGLSGGEKQRVVLARTFLKRPNIILFDEPTTGLDVHTEEVLQQSMNKLREYATVITVAHRIQTIRSADKIVLMEQGSIRAIGTDRELLQEDELYQSMMKLQQGGEV
ncbi:ABC transporter ATP-binding protein [Oceanobacillus sp. E9]|uniref:thiol reductant ABC exporter subunit CydD n=1 Tax=Oceanobacillus TaxID=182709 RepID=UPI00084E8362|nr:MULTISPECIES: thiol reductant ABC exporter subunit CydD [Oceanobacillus]OEH54194.1 ABC transporter ATP-binding protein [Oceanobacillus sp. E9]